MKLAVISLIVGDYDESIDWYRRVRDLYGNRWDLIELR